VQPGEVVDVVPNEESVVDEEELVEKEVDDEVDDEVEADASATQIT
jgi:hypothetical protein